MKISARATLAVVALLVGLLALTGLSSGLTTALAQPLPTPTIPNLLGSPTPTKDPVPVPGGEEEEEEEGGGSKPSGGGGGTKPSGGGGGDDEGSNEEDRRPGARKAGSRTGARGNDKRKNGKKNKKGARIDDFVTPPSSIAGRIPGAYDTSKLVATAIRLRSLGMTQEEVVSKVFPPFIIAGKASWIDTWGAPRYGPAPGQIRTHEGQDVFCDYGDPILAPEAGTITMDDGGLGGITARVHRPDGKYWYMTHLSALNRSFRNGDRVQVGDVVGYCGNSGNAATTPPHVHFGFYNSGGVNATNPMKHLVKWLRLAENRVLGGSSGEAGVVAKATRKRQRQAPTLTAARRFGDAFAPDRSDFRIAGESLWASGTSPASGAFGLAEAALQEALSTNGTELGILPTPLDLQLPQSQGQETLAPDTMLARILAEATHNTHSHVEGTD